MAGSRPDARTLPGGGSAIASIEAAPRTGSLVHRVLAGVIFIPALILLARQGGWWFLILVEILILEGLLEFFHMVELKGMRPYRSVGLIGGLLIGWGMYHDGGIAAGGILSLVLLAAVGLELTRRDGSAAVYHMATVVLGVVYVAWLLGHLVLLRELPWVVGRAYGEGASYVLVAFFLTWSSDTGAYLVGRVIGRRKLLPRVSPHKSLEGSLGGGLACVGAALGARAWFADYLGWGECLALGLLVAVLGQLGDLAESLIKRDVGIKDASRIIPGHGGVLDRFDSMLFAAPCVYYFLRFVVLR